MKNMCMSMFVYKYNVQWCDGTKETKKTFCVDQAWPLTDLMEGLHHSHHVIEDDNGLTLAQSLFLYNIMLKVY